MFMYWLWKVEWNMTYWFNLDIPNLQNVSLHGDWQGFPFQKVINPVINSLYCILLYFLDVSEILFPKVYNYDYMQSIQSSVTSIIIPNWVSNDPTFTTLDFSRFIRVESIEIGNNCFASVKTFKIEGMHKLKSLKIGLFSFTKMKSQTCKGDESKSFHIINCKSLESIDIGEFSFSDFGGQFELRRLPSLLTLVIGNTRTMSLNFSGSSFVIGGRDKVLNIWMSRSSKSYIHYIRWFHIFEFSVNSNRKYWMNLIEVISIDLPSLQFIQLGSDALAGDGNSSCSLIMRSMNNIVWTHCE